MNEKYINWLKNNPSNWSIATVKKYESAVRIVSQEMLSKGIIDKEIYDMNVVEIDIAINVILNNIDFIQKNKIGNNMYSNGLKQYRCYLHEVSDINAEDLVVSEIEKSINDDSTLTATEKETIIKSRIGQGKFRDRLIAKYHKCLITGETDSRVLVASHIRPWAVSDNENRLSVYNGLLLVATFDSLFDKGLISFKRNGQLIVSKSVSAETEKRLNIPVGQIFDLPEEKIFMENMEYHRDKIFVC